MASDPAALFDSDDIGWLERADHEVESECVERKQSFDAKEIARQISAMANADGGLVVVGVDRGGLVRGLGDQAGTVRDRVSKIPVEGCDFRHRFVSVRGGAAELLFVLVPKASQCVVCTTEGRAFVREGSSTVELDAEQILELRYSRGETRYEDRPVARYTPDLLDPAIADEFLEGVVQRNGLTMPATLEDALANKRLVISHDGSTHLTVAGLVALGRQPTDLIPGARIHFVKLDGRQERFGAERNVVKERWFDGPTRRMLDEIRTFLRTLIGDFDYLGKDGTFVTEPEYPELAWDEALVNALVHRSYSLSNAPVVVRMFEDRLEVESPGGYPGPVRPNADGVFPLSYPRNPRLGEALRYLGLVRLAREGTRRMKAEMDKLGLPHPSYQEIDTVGVRVTLRNDIDRRRPGASAESQPQMWRKVAEQLREDLAIYRRKAYDTWSRLHSLRANAPQEVIEAAGALLDREEITDDERNRIAHLLADEATPEVDAWAQEWVRRLESPQAPAVGSDRSPMLRILARSPRALEAILDLLERNLVPDPAGRVLAFDALRQRLSANDLPPREWIDHALRVCKYPEAKSLYFAITEQSLPEL